MDHQKTRSSDVIDSIGGDGSSQKGRRRSQSVSYDKNTTCPSMRTRRESIGGLRFNNTPHHPTSFIMKTISDATDSSPIQNRENSLLLVKKETLMPVSRESNEYNMNHSQRGFAIIFNHEKYEDMSARDGTDVDVKHLSAVYELLGFKVEIYNNLNYTEIHKTIEEVSKRDHGDCDCLLITVLTHGLNCGLIYARDFPYKTDHLWLPFTADNCLSLAGKPKIFIIQACRGDLLDGGTLLCSNSQTDSACSSSYTIPSMADFLFVYSTVQGYFSWRHPENGTWFIQCLCEVLNEQYETTDFLRIMVRVSRKVAIDFQSYHEYLPEFNEKKQVPNIDSTLIRDIYFRSKPR